MMKLIKSNSEILTNINENLLKSIELYGRICYKSENKITEKSTEKFIKHIIKNGHHSVIEHINISVKIICDRGISHELVRHRLASFSQESTRYVNYGTNCTYIIPSWFEHINECNNKEFNINDNLDNFNEDEKYWIESIILNELHYHMLLFNFKWNPQKARSILCNSTKTELIITANLREWRHIFNLRCSRKAHPQMQEIMIPLMIKMSNAIPIIFDDIKEKYIEGVNNI